MAMDSVELNEILECSLCLERLDHTSKVLPCQHTFCGRCLKEILCSRKELRCPEAECGVLVSEDIDDLPPNILLVRILEGLNRRKPKLPETSDHETVLEQRHSKEPCAKVLYDYEPKEQGDLALTKGDIVMLLQQIDGNWYEGQVNGLQGFLPSNYVEVINALPNLDDYYDDPVAKALYDFDDGQEQDILTFKQGEVISVTRRVDENWCEGKLNNKCGIFPINFVEFNSVARAVTESAETPPPPPNPRASTSYQPPATSSSETNNRATNGAPHFKPARKSKTLTRDKAPKRHTIHGSEWREKYCDISCVLSRHSVEISSSERLEEVYGPAASDPAIHEPPISVTTAVANDRRPSFYTDVDQDKESSSVSEQHRLCFGEFIDSLCYPVQGSSETAPLTFALVRPGTNQVSDHTPSTSSFTQSTSPGYSRPNSADFGKELYTAIYNYRPQKEDELELKQGGSYCVLEKCKDGWFKGFSVATQKRGVFPGNYVRLASIHSLLMRSRAVCSGYNSQEAPVPSPRQCPVGTALGPRYHRSESSPNFHNRPTVPMESLEVNLNGGVIAEARGSNTAANDGGQDQLLLLPQSPVPKTAGFWRKLKTKKKDKTSLLPPPPPYTWNVPRGHSQVNIPIPATPPPRYTIQQVPVKHLAQAARERRSHHRQENVAVSERCRVTLPYPPQSEAELELRVGDIVYVSKKRQDGWYKGTLERNGKTGLFPGCFSEKF